MPMKNPPHPGGFVLRQCIEPLGLSITDATAALGVTRTTLSELVNEMRGISPEVAVRLSKVLGGSAESWLVQQAQMILPKFAPTALSSNGLSWPKRCLIKGYGADGLARSAKTAVGPQVTGFAPALTCVTPPPNRGKRLARARMARYPSTTTCDACVQRPQICSDPICYPLAGVAIAIRVVNAGHSPVLARVIEQPGRL
jgi:addiction module HigA family antidote